MTHCFQPRFSCRVGVVVSLICMWVLGSAGVFLFIHGEPQWFLALGGYDASTLNQIGLFYLGCTVAQIPSLTFAAFIITMSEFRRPVRAAFWITLGWHVFLLGIHAARWPWSGIPGLDQSIPWLAEFVSLAMLVGYTVLLTRLVLLYDVWKTRH